MRPAGHIILLPTYNEAVNLPALVEAILRASDGEVLVFVMAEELVVTAHH